MRLVLVRRFNRRCGFSRLSGRSRFLRGDGLGDQFFRTPIADRLQGKSLVGRHTVTSRTVRHRNFSIEDLGQAGHADPEVVIAMGDGPERLHRIHRDTLPLLSKRTTVPACRCQHHAQRLASAPAPFSHFLSPARSRSISSANISNGNAPGIATAGSLSVGSVAVRTRMKPGVP